MEKPHYKAILLFLSSDTEIIHQLLKSRQMQYKDKDVRFLFLFAYADKIEPIDSWDIVANLPKKMYPHEKMAKQTFFAIENIVEKYSFDYLIRTNLSTFWILDRLYNRLVTLKDDSNVYGKFGWIPPEFIVGQDLIIPKNLVYKLIDTKQEYLEYVTGTKGVAEDRLLSSYLKEKLGAIYNNTAKTMLIAEHITDITYSSIEKVLLRSEDTQIDHVRIKNHRTDRVTVDNLLFNCLIKHHYII